MGTENCEALHYARTDPRLTAAFTDAPLTPPRTLGFLLPKDDADYSRVMHFVWDLLEQRGVVKQAGQKWLKWGLDRLACRSPVHFPIPGSGTRRESP